MGVSLSLSMGLPVWARSRPRENRNYKTSQKLEQIPIQNSPTHLVSNTSPTQSPPNTIKPPPIFSNSLEKISSLELKPAEVVIQGPGVQDLPASTKQGSDNPCKWYKQFARNMGGMRENKPYKNLQWPPPPPQD